MTHQQQQEFELMKRVTQTVVGKMQEMLKRMDEMEARLEQLEGSARAPAVPAPSAEEKGPDAAPAP